MTASRNASGFTLIEVLVSIVILSTGIVLVLRAFETSAVALAEARDHAWSTFLMGGLLDEAKTYADTHPGELPSPSSGRFDGIYRDYRWQLSTRPYTGGAADVAGCGDSRPVLVTVAVWKAGRPAYESSTILRPRPVPDPEEEE